MLTRRRFLSNSCTLGVASAVAPLVPAGNVVAESDLPGHRALVCILLAGGNDSFNMLVPTEPKQYTAYKDARSNLALNRDDLLPLSGKTANGGNFGLHPSMSALRDIYSNGDAAFLANTGSLRKRPDAKVLRTGGGALPEDLLTHSGQLNQWQTGLPFSRSTSGWAGRMADVLQDSSSARNVSMNLSVTGQNVFQLGEISAPHNIEVAGARRARKVGNSAGVDFDFVNEQLAGRFAGAGRPRHLETKAARQKLADASTRKGIVSAAQHTRDLGTSFAPDAFSQQLAEVARIIAARDDLGSRRQTFYVSLNGWDHHHHLLSNHATMLTTLSRGLQSFRDALIEIDAFNDVTTFTISEFGRALKSNGSGSDHGWGGHQIVMGGGVRGGQIYGTYPDLSPSNPLNIGDGVYAPTTSTDEYFAELALWLGLPTTQLDYVLPNLRTFQTASSENPPIGFVA